jgi:hypothetical protein
LNRKKKACIDNNFLLGMLLQRSSMGIIFRDVFAGHTKPALHSLSVALFYRAKKSAVSHHQYNRKKKVTRKANCFG